MNSVYDFEVTAIDGSVVSVNQFRGKVLLIVNVAGKCLFTMQYRGLEALYKKYHDRGFEVLGFPCNQFLWQDRGDSHQCRVNYGVTFPVFAEIKVNGRSADPLFKWLKTQKPGLLGTGLIKWNFTKFLVNREGIPMKRFGPATFPSAIEPAIESCLAPRQ